MDSSLEPLIGLGLGVLVLAGALAFYLLPTVIAASRDHKRFWAIFWINLFFGWTFIGWVVAAAWAILTKD